MTQNIKILITDIPEALHSALSEQFLRMKNITIIGSIKFSTAPDLIIADNNYKNPYIACPIIKIDGNTKQRLSDLLKKTYQALEHPISHIDEIKINDNIIFKPVDKIIVDNNDVEISLTDREVDILIYLAKNSKNSITREQLLKDVWKYQEGVDTHTIETHIYRLRQKIEKILNLQNFIITTDNGYKIEL